MCRILRNRKILLCALLPDLAAEDIDFEKYKKARGVFLEYPWERVKSIFSRDDYGNLHPEMTATIQASEVGLLIGFLFGAIRGMRKESENFFRTSDANIYQSKYFAYKALYNQTMVAAVKGAFKWGLPLGLFTGTYSLVSSCSQMYRNKINVVDNIIGGVAVGALYRFMFGFRGMMIGGLLGGIIGTLHGTYIWAVCKLMKTDALEVKYAHFAFSKRLNEASNFSSVENPDDSAIIKSGLHFRHVSNPLNTLENEEKEEKK